MNGKTERELRRISAGVPLHLQQNLEREEVDTSQEEIMKQYIRDNRNHMSASKIYKLEKLIESGALRTKEKVVDERTAKEIERYNKMMVEKSRAQGKLDDPEKDSWFRHRMAKIAKMAR
jgi:hypothetical protein